MTRIVPPIPGALGPIGDLSAGSGWTLTDPSGIIASPPVSDGGVVTVGFNAVAGVAFLTRPLSLDREQYHLAAAQMSKALAPLTAGAQLVMTYGFAEALGVSHVTSGLEITSTSVRAVNYNNNGRGAGANVIDSGFRSSIHTVQISDMIIESVSRTSDTWLSLGRTNNSPLPRTDPLVATTGANDHECLRFEFLGTLAAETVAWNVLTAILTPFTY